MGSTIQVYLNDINHFIFEKNKANFLELAGKQNNNGPAPTLLQLAAQKALHFSAQPQYSNMELLMKTKLNKDIKERFVNISIKNFTELLIIKELIPFDKLGVFCKRLLPDTQNANINFLLVKLFDGMWFKLNDKEKDYLKTFTWRYSSVSEKAKFLFYDTNMKVAFVFHAIFEFKEIFVLISMIPGIILVPTCFRWSVDLYNEHQKQNEEYQKQWASLTFFQKIFTDPPKSDESALYASLFVAALPVFVTIGFYYFLTGFMGFFIKKWYESRKNCFEKIEQRKACQLWLQMINTPLT